MLKPWFVLPLIGLAMHQSIHGVLSAFAALLWKQQGIPEGYIGAPDRGDGVRRGGDDVRLALHQDQSVGAAPDHLCRRWSAATRWIIMAFAPPLWLLFSSSCSTAITYAVAYFGGMQFIANWTSEDIAAEAQGFAFVLQQGISIVALVGFGWLVGARMARAPGSARRRWRSPAVVLTLISLRLQPVHAAAHCRTERLERKRPRCYHRGRSSSDALEIGYPRRPLAWASMV